MLERTHPKPTLWVISELYYPEETSTGYYLTRIAEGLTGEFAVRVICGQPNYSARGIRSPRRERHNDVDITRAFGTLLDKNVLWFRLINMLSLSLSTFFTALAGFRSGDGVLVVTTPPSLPFIVALASRLRRARYVLLIHDTYPDILVTVRKARDTSLLVRVLNRLNRWLYRHASRIVVVGRDMQESMAARTPDLNVPIDVIPNWAELEQVEPAPREGNPLLRELGLLDRLVFLYAGNMGHPNDIESIIACADALKDDGSFHFIFLGAGVKRRWLETEVERRRLGNVTLLAPRPRADQKIFLNACDVGVVTLVRGMWGVSMPSRTYNILAAGKPILALTEAGSEIARVIEEDGVGWIVPPGDPDALMRTLREIHGRRDCLRGMGENARRTAVQNYSLTVALDKYRAVLTKALAAADHRLSAHA